MDLNRPLAIVTPTIDGDILGVLARHDATFTTGQLHRILHQHSEEGIRKVVKRLARQGIVDSGRVGNAFFYSLNRDHLGASHIIGLADLKGSLLLRIEERLASWEFPPVYAAIFGSVATGSMTVDSDLDLMLVRPTDAAEEQWEGDLATLVADLARWTGNEVRPLVFRAEEIHQNGKNEPVLRDVLDQGLTVAGSRNWLNAQLRSALT